MKNKGYTKSKLGKGLVSKVDTEKSKSSRKNEKISECYKMKLEHSEELNPDDFE